MKRLLKLKGFSGGLPKICSRREGDTMIITSLEELRTALEAQRNECSVHPYERKVDRSCAGCAEGEPDPLFAPLLSLVREECWDCKNGLPASNQYPEPRGTHSGRLCHGTGFIARTDWGRDIGALGGALDYAVSKIEGQFEDRYYFHHPAGEVAPDFDETRALTATLEEMKK